MTLRIPRAVLIAAIAISALTLAGCGSGDKEGNGETTTPSVPQASETTTLSVPQTKEQIQEVCLPLREMYGEKTYETCLDTFRK